MTNRIDIQRIGLLLILITLSMLPIHAQSKKKSKMRFDISFPSTSSRKVLDGRLLLIISTDN
ncbi:MAG: hypothetical protein ACRD4L_11695, partial [Pyrinomonadaceae bacterium]